MKKSLIETLKKNTEESTIDEYLSPIINDFKISLTHEIHSYGFERVVKSKKRSQIKEYLKLYSNFNNEFDELIPSDGTKEKYKKLLWEIFSYELRYEGTGIIIAGYNLKSNKPSFVELNVHCNDQGTIIYDEIDTEINSEKPKLKIFAINEEGYTFITGVNEEFISFIIRYIEKRNNKIINNISEDLKEEKIKKHEKILNIIKKELHDEYSSLDEDIIEYRLDAIKYTTNAIEYLPRKLIFEFLDTINQLTAIKQQISSEIESVSKGSHCCLITKTSGFQWIKFDDEIL